MNVTGSLLVREHDVDSIRDRVARGRVSELRKEPGAITLGAVLELACCWRAWRSTSSASGGVALLERWAERFPALEDAYAALNGDSLTVAEPLGAPVAELLSIRSASDLTGLEGKLFLDRFRRSLSANGFSSKDSHALAGALDEMADNIVQHSAPNAAASAPGVIGFHVGERWMSFAVADIGQGVLASLRTNPLWTSTKDDKEALSNAVMHRATRRTEERLGNGFYDLHRALADMSGRLRFRSGEGALVLDGRGQGSRSATWRRTPHLSGFQLVVLCGLDPEPPVAGMPHVLT